MLALTTWANGEVPRFTEINVPAEQAFVVLSYYLFFVLQFSTVGIVGRASGAGEHTLEETSYQKMELCTNLCHRRGLLKCSVSVRHAVGERFDELNNGVSNIP